MVRESYGVKTPCFLARCGKNVTDGSVVVEDSHPWPAQVEVM